MRKIKAKFSIRKLDLEEGFLEMDLQKMYILILKGSHYPLVLFNFVSLTCGQQNEHDAAAAAADDDDGDGAVDDHNDVNTRHRTRSVRRKFKETDHAIRM